MTITVDQLDESAFAPGTELVIVYEKLRTDAPVERTRKLVRDFGWVEKKTELYTKDADGKIYPIPIPKGLSNRK